MFHEEDITFKANHKGILPECNADGSLIHKIYTHCGSCIERITNLFYSYGFPKKFSLFLFKFCTFSARPVQGVPNVPSVPSRPMTVGKGSSTPEILN